MSGTVKHKRLESPTARSRLKRGRQAHWQALEEGRVHLGYQCRKGEPPGRWLLRRYIGHRKYRVEALGLADDATDADGKRILSHKQAIAKANAIVAQPETKADGPLTVRQAWEDYIKAKEDKGQPVDDLNSRGKVHILPVLGDLFVGELTAKKLRDWHATMARAPAQIRSKGGKPQYRKAPTTDDGIRARRASANRVLTMLKAALNLAFKESKGAIKNRDAWGKESLEPFENVEVARVSYLKIAEAQRLVNASDPEFRPLVQAALETGCRYSELTRLRVTDFQIIEQKKENGDLMEVGQITIRQSKSGKSRIVTLTPEGADFFRQHCAGRSGNEIMFRHDDGAAWQKSEQARPMREACEHARITPSISFHILRHTWASLSVMARVPLLVVAQNLGHKDTRMVEKHYGHLAPSFITEAIHAGAPRFGVATPTAVTPLHVGKSKRK
jgi:integrase